MVTGDISIRRTNLSSVKQSLLEKLTQAKRAEKSETQVIPRRAERDTAALSFAQQRLWFIDQLEPGSALYNMPVAVRLQGRLNVSALERTLSEIVRRHEVLRTTFAELEGEPVQIINEAAPVALPVIELSGLAADEREAEVKRLSHEEAQTPFDLSRGPLLRVTLLKLADDEHVVLFTMHHIVSDGWSLGLLVKEVAALYEAFTRGDSSPLAELPIQYADFAAWQREWLQGETLQEQLNYWKSHLTGAPPVLELQTDRPRPAVQTSRGAFETINLSAEITEKLKSLSRREGATLFMTLLAAWQTLLSRYSGQQDIVVGADIANRNRRETEELIGFFVNMLVLRTDLTGDPSFSELLKRVREVTLGAYAHQDVPFEKLVEELQPERDLSHAPLFQVLFVLQNAPVGELTVSGLSLSPVEGDGEKVMYDLILDLQETGDRIRGSLRYNTDLFDQTTVERMARHLERLLETIAVNPEQKLSTLSLLDPAEQRQLLLEWNDTASDYPRHLCIHELFEQQAAETPDSVAILFGDEQLSYTELNKRANQLAHHLREMGVGPEVTVGLCMERSVEMVIALLGILKAGGAYVPLDPQYPMERLAFMLSDAEMPVLLTQEHLLDELPSYWGQIVCLDTEWELISRQGDGNQPGGARADNLAYVIYTSGSTGRPKGVSVTHRGVVRLVKETNYVELNASEVILQLAPISFDASTFEIWGSLLNGAKLALMPARQPSLDEIAGALERYGVTTLWLTAGLFNLMVDEQSESLSVVRQLLAGGDVLSVSHARKFLQTTGSARLINGYGPTENTTFTCCYPMTDASQIGNSVSIGRPISNTQVYILDENLQPVPVGVAGYLYTGGDGLARCYLNRPELTAEKFIPNPFGTEPGARLYQTGDLARYLTDGTIEFMGRRDDQVKVRGFRIELGEIESALSAHAAISEALMLVREDVVGDKRLVAYVVTAEPSALVANELRAFLKERLPDYMIPQSFVTLEALPLTANGKIDRRALPAPTESGTVTCEKFVAPRTPVEEVIAGIWCEVLKVERVGIEDDFFDLGGHSLLATQVISRIRESLQVEVALRALFESPTVAGLSEAVEQQMSEHYGVEQPPVIPVSREQQLPLSFAQQRLWFIDQLEPNSSLYNIPAALRLTGQLDIAALEQTLSEVVRRHEVLRTTFTEVNGEPVQVINEAAPVALPVIELGELAEPEREAEVKRLSREEAQMPFDLSHGPLLRVTLLRLTEDEHVLLFTVHHIISDGWSMGVLVKEVAALYEAFTRGAESPLAELQVQYADFAAWQRQWSQSGALEKQLAYWREQLQDAPPVLELPTDRPRSAMQTRRGGQESFILSTEMTQKLKALSRREGATLFMTLLAAWQTFLARYSGQDDIVVGTPIANRNRQETEELIGFFVNTLVVRGRTGGDPSFREFLREVREATLSAYAHQDVPFEKLVEELQPDRDVNHTPLFQVLFVLQNAPVAALELPGLKMSPVETEGTTAKFDLMLAMSEGQQGAHAVLEYNRDLFEATTIRRMIRHFETLLEGIVSHAEEKLSALPLLDRGEQELLLAWNETGRVYPRQSSIPELFEAQAARHPEVIALVLGEEQVSYRELNERANQVAHYLRRLGVRPEMLVGLMLERSVEQVVALLGILKAGGAYVPLDPHYPQARLRLMLEDAQLTVLLTEEPLLAALPEHRAQVICLEREREQLAGESRENPQRRIGADHLAYVIYTSGSTGSPKGVSVTHRAVVRLVKETNYVHLDAEQTLLQASPVTFDASTFELWGALLNGARLILFAERIPTASALRASIAGHGVTTMWLTSSLFNAVMDEDATALEGLKQLLIGGEALSVRHVRRALEQLPDVKLINGYGPTENTTFTCCHQIERGLAAEAMSVSIGRPISNTQVYILDENLQPVPVGVAGYLYTGGDGLARCYLNRPELTAERFIPNPFSSEGGQRLYQTGDVARYLADGTIEFMGRRDEQVKVRGFRIELGEIETVLGQHASVSEVVVVVREDVAGDKRVVAYVVGAGEQLPEGGELRSFLKERVPEYMVPHLFVTLEALPLSSSGKVDRRALPAPQAVRTQTPEQLAAPRTPVEEVLAGIWCEVLKVERVGVHEDFFQLGGHSLLATQVTSRVREALQVEVALRQVFESPTVAGFARCVEVALGERQGVQAPPIEPTGREQRLPLSFAQQRLWFIDQLEPNSSLYNIPAALRLTGRLDIPALERTLSEVVRRHEVLRTTFAQVDGEPVQVIREAETLSLPVVELNRLTAEEREAEVNRLSQEEAQTPFDLSRGPLLRVTLLKLSGDEHVVLFTMHHIISDGWSMGVLVKEVAALYAAFTQDNPSPLSELEVQYADFAAWQRQWLQGEVLEQQLSYWKKQLADAPPVLELPTDRVRPAVQRRRGAQESFVLDEELTEQLKALSRREGATLFMTLLAAWQTLLARYSGQTDIVVGADIANRNRRETEELIGFFVNMLVLRTDLSGDPTFGELMKRVREVTLGAYAHQDVPFEKLVEELQPERDLSHAPLFQVLFVLQNAPGGKLALPGLELSPVEADGGSVMFDLILDMQEVDGRLGGILRYNADLFDAETIVRMIEHLQILLKDIVATPEQRLSELRLVSAEERHQILVGWNETTVSYPREKCVHELFEEQAAARPEAVAIIFNEERITYTELNKRANQLAHHLRRLGVGPDMLVGLCMERSVEMVIALLGILKAGGAYVPLDPQYPMERLAFMLEDAAAPVLLTQEHLLDELPAHWAQVICLDAEWELIAEESDENPASVTMPENLAYINYTSGSTGRPKGVEVAHRGVNRLLFGVDYVHLDAEQTLLQASPVTFDASTFELWGALLNGARLILFAERIPTASALRASIAGHGVTTMWLTSSLFNAVMDEDATALEGLKQLLIGGEALSVRHVRRALEQLPEVRLINGYGPTENTTFTCCYPMTDASQIGNSVSIGRPISNTQVYILDENLQPVPVGVAGELYIGGDGLARGYLNRPELTAEKFVPNPFSGAAGARLYKTGDVARYLADGTIEFIGRRDDQVKVRGFRIELGEIESALSAHALISEAVVVVREDAPGDKRLVAYVVAADEQSIEPTDLRHYLREKLPDYMVPHLFVVLEALPLTPSGKVDRRALPTPEQARTEAEDTYVAPRTPVEEELARIWSEVLGVERIGVHDDFFELGGHSLLATQVVSRVRDAFQVELALRQMFESPTVGGLSTVVEQSQSVKSEPQSPAIVRVSREARRLTQTAAK